MNIQSKHGLGLGKVFVSLCLLLIVGIGSQSVHAAISFIDKFNVEDIGMNEGLEHDFVDDIKKDSYGFIWVAMQGGGLSRYDGNSFTNFGRNSAHLRLKSNFISQVQEDPYKRMWVISDDGLDIIDLNMMHKSPIEADPRIAGLLNHAVYSIERDAHDCMWLLTADSLYRFSFDEQGKVVNRLSNSVHCDNQSRIVLKDAEQNGTIWMAIEGQICSVTANEECARLDQKLVSECLVFDPLHMFIDFQAVGNDVWIASDGGLIRYNKSLDSKKVYVNKPGDNHSLSQNFVTDILVTTDNHLVVSTFVGMNVYNPLTDGFERIGDNASPNSLFAGKYINCLYEDQGTIWIGCESYGIVKLSPKRLNLVMYAYDDAESSISPNPVNAIYFDERETLWVGTVEGGLNMRRKGSVGFKHFSVETGTLSHNSVSAIAEDAHGHLWVGTWGRGVNILDRNTPEHCLKRIDYESTHRQFTLDFVGALCYDSINNAMWIGTNQGIFVYDFATDMVHDPMPQFSFMGSLGAVIDHKGHLWMGAKQGLIDVNLHSMKSGKLDYRVLENADSIAQDHALRRISYVYLASDGALWVSSFGCGLYKRELDAQGQEHFTNYNVQNGLINNNVRGIVEDRLGNLWVSTNNGLSCFQNKKTWVNYGKADGIGNAKFYWNASAISHAGHVFMGGVDGLLEIVPERTTVEQQSPVLKFTHLYVGNEEVFAPSLMLNRDITVADRVQIHEKDRNFSVVFSALDYSAFHASSTYYYKLEGFDSDWLRVRNGNQALNYTNLAPGHYQLLVRSGAVDDDKSTVMASLNIDILPYFYKTFWFRTLALLCFLALLWMFLRWRIRTLLRQRRELHHEVVLRTSELQEKKNLLEVKTSELEQQNSLLIEQNEKILTQKNKIEDMARQVKSLMVERLSFYTNITHEFRTPITLIMGPIQRALRMTTDEKVGEQLHIVERNSRYLLQLVNQLMDFRKLESGKYDIVKSKCDFEKFVLENLSAFRQYAAERGIEIKSYLHLPVKEFELDEDAMQKVLTNLLSNAIKFTPNGGQVSLYAAVLPTTSPNEDRRLFLSVSDTGVGIPEEDLDKVFERFYQSKNQISFPIFGASSSGIGLYLSHEMVEMQGGRIWVKRNPVKGACFRILMPVKFGDPVALNAAVQRPDALSSVPEDDASAETDSPKKTILVVEDNEDMRLYIRSILDLQYAVLEAENGAVAMSVLQEHHVDLILSDLMMPVMDGMELSRNVKSNFATSHIPIVILTAKKSQISKVESYKIGVDEFLVKPFDEDELLAVIGRIFMNLKRYQQLFSQHYNVEHIEIAQESSDKKFVDQVMSVLSKNYKNSYFDVGDFCEEMGVSKTLLNNKLQTLMGQSTLQLLRGYRLSIAHDMLVKNKELKSMSIAEIAYEVGFNDPKYFTRCFTKQYDCPPSAI